MQEREKESVGPGGGWRVEDSQSEWSEGSEPAGAPALSLSLSLSLSLYSQIILISHNWTNTRDISSHFSIIYIYIYTAFIFVYQYYHHG